MRVDDMAGNIAASARPYQLALAQFLVELGGGGRGGGGGVGLGGGGLVDAAVDLLVVQLLRRAAAVEAPVAPLATEPLRRD